jgi:HKD family nuclease
MIVIKKLAAPFINNKILHEAEHCYIATAAISDAGFDFVRTRLSPKCKMQIVTGLDVLSSPGVFRRIWKHYQDRIDIRFYTRNFFHANVYIFDLPFRKSVAFIGSGHLTLEGLKDNEEIFNKTIDPKEIEELKSWFTGYFEFSPPLTEQLIQEYELLYPAMKQREIASREEKKTLMELTSGGFNWDNIKFKNQYFKKEDYLVFENRKASLDAEENRNERRVVHDKLVALHDQLKSSIAALKLSSDPTEIVRGLESGHHREHQVRSMWISYGRSEAERKKYEGKAPLHHFMRLQLVIAQNYFGIHLVAGTENTGQQDREHFQTRMYDAEYRALAFRIFASLGDAYWIQVAGERRPVTGFKTEAELWDFTKADDWRYYTFSIGRDYSPGDPAISSQTIQSTIVMGLETLLPLYKHVRHQPS